MPLSAPRSSPVLQTGPVQPVAGNGSSAVGVSALLHATVAALAVSTGIAHTARVSIDAGSSRSDTVIRISASLAAPETMPLELAALGIPEGTPVDVPLSIEPVLVPAVPPVELQDLEKRLPVAAPEGSPQADSKADQADPADSPSETAVVPTIESDATSASRPGAEVPQAARPLPSNLPPAYPSAAIEQGRSGRVVLRVLVTTEGTAAAVSVVASSGHQDLDEAAIAAVRGWRFEPARHESLVVEQAIAVPIRFDPR